MVPKNMFVKIYVFDDGNDKYKDYINKWKIIDYMFNGDKLKLMNVNNVNVIINSISTWKTLRI